MMKKILCTFLILPAILFSQEDVFTYEVEIKEDLVYYKGKLLDGHLLEYDENAKTPNKCILDTQYKSGLRHGKETKWYLNGSKKYEGTFQRGIKVGKHHYYLKNGDQNYTYNYNKGKLTEKTSYHASGRTKSVKKFDTISANIIHHSQYFDDDEKTLQLLENYENGVFHGNQMKRDQHKNLEYEKEYDGGKLIQSKEYENAQLVKVQSLDQKKDVFITKEYLQGKISKQFSYRDGQKHGSWFWFNSQGHKTKEQQYDSDFLLREGLYVDNKKDGYWDSFDKNGIHQTATLYKDDQVIKETTFKKTSLISYYTNLENTFLFDTGNEVVLVYMDSSFSEEGQSTWVRDKLVTVFSKYLIAISEVSDPYKLYDKIVYLTNLDFQIEKFDYVDKFSEDKSVHTGYHAYIKFNFRMNDAKNKTVYSKSMRINKSNKILNSLFNNAAQTHNTTIKDAIVSSVQAINLKKFFKKVYPQHYKRKK